MATVKMMWLILTITFGVFMKGHFATPEYKVYCFETDSGHKSTIRVRANNNIITGLQAYDSSIDPESFAQTSPYTDDGCKTTSYTNHYPGVYSLTMDSGDCGGQALRQVRFLGTNDYVEYNCGGSYIPKEVTDSVTVNPPTPVAHHDVYPNPFDINCMVFAASGWNAPVWEAEYGQDLSIRCIYNMGEMPGARDNWGYSFHIVFPTHVAATYMGIEIYTPGLGTRATVVVNSDKLNLHINEKVYVKRDSPYRRGIFPLDMDDTDTSSDAWYIEDRGIKITSLDDVIAVRVISYSATSSEGSSYMALPDRLLGDDYRLPSQDGQNAVAIIYVAEDDTDITFEFNNFRDVLELDIASTTLTTPYSNGITVQLDEMDVLTVKCDSDCMELVIKGDKTFGVVFAIDNENPFTGPVGHMMTQVTPVQHYGYEFVLVTPTGLNGQYLYLSSDPSVINIEVSDIYSTTTVKPDEPLLATDYDSHVYFEEPVAIYFHSEGSANSGPAVLAIPSVAQWGNNYHFYARAGRAYKLTFVGKNLAGISFTTGSVETNLGGTTTLEDQIDYASDVVIIYTLDHIDDDQYYTYELDITVTGTLEQDNGGLIEFMAEERWQCFGLFILETWDDHTESYLPMGVRWTLSPDELDPTAPFIRPGDGRDNDGDGKVDEEIQNGVDDDGDGSIDEDVTTHNMHGATGVFAENVDVCDTTYMDCHAISTGCYFDDFDFERADDTYLKQFQGFEHNTDLAAEFDHLYVIDTLPFNIWRHITSANGELTFEVMYGMCFGNLTLCEQSCQEKRSTEHHQTWAVRTTIPFHSNGTDPSGNKETESGTTDNFKSNPCSGSPVFWIPVSLLLIMVLIASMATVFFLYKRAQFINRIKNLNH